MPPPPPPPGFSSHETATTATSSATPTSSVNEAKAPQHKRVYQACIPCRRRKVKCNLGSVDNPTDPPCQRCRRESKDCFFSATRRKRKTDEDGPPESSDDYVVRNGRKRLHSETETSPTPPRPQPSASSRPYGFLDTSAPLPPLTPGGSVGRPRPLQRPNESVNGSENVQEDPNSRWENLEAQKVMSREVYGPHDALDLLYKAATNSSGHKRIRSISNTQQASTIRNGTTAASYTQTAGDMSTTAGLSYNPSLRPPDSRNTALDPALSADERGYSETNRDPGYIEALKAWARFRFVRAGWFTPAEAIAYIEYYYKYLSPLSPISPPTFRDPGTHVTLLTEEPILTVTLLTIATRYMKMTGPGGHCRSHAIHEQLWTYLRGMIERCLWGQEAFGGGFCGSGGSEIHDAQGSSTAPWRGLRKGSLRTLGTVESLMILTEWHPRALHFPPAEATDELMLPDYNVPDTTSTEDGGDNHRVPGGVGGKRIESWLEPAWRSDRMCWMLLSNGMGLSYELGVFDKIEEMLAAGGEMARPEYEDEAYRLRASRVKKLLLIYVTQLAGRLGWTNMVPEDLRTSEPAFEHRRRKASNDFNSPGTNTTVSNTFQYIPDLELDDQIIHCWSSITTVMRIGNERLFRSRKHTTSIIQNGKYIELLKDFQPMLSTWLKDFERFTLPPYIKHILAIEYEYVRIYLNSLSLQAVVERCTNSAGISGPHNGNRGGLNMAALSPETQNYYGKLPLAKLGGYGEADSEYVKQVVDGSRSLLKTVVEGLLPGGYLKHAPVRTYFRIISGAMFLLKTFALGAPKNEIEFSIGLMDKAVDALRNCVVDDVHLGIRFAELLDTLTTRLRNRFIHSAFQHQPPAASSGTQSPANGSQNLQQPYGPENRDARMPWNVNAGASNFDHMANQSDLNAPITATPFDPNSHAQSFYQKSSTPLPAPYSGQSIYPPGNGNGTVSNDMNDAYGMERDEAEDFWYLPTGAAFFQNNDQPITQTAEGVNVGGWDLLDLMTMDQFPLGADTNF